MKSWLFLQALLLASVVHAKKKCVPGTVKVLAKYANFGIVHPTPPLGGGDCPEGIVTVGNYVITSGPATFGTAGGAPSQLTVVNSAGAFVRSISVQGENVTNEHALSEAQTWGPYVFAPSTQLGVIRWDFSNNDPFNVPQKLVSTPFPQNTICASNAYPFGPLPNGLDVDAGGTIYVADSLQGIIWTIAHAATPQVPQVFFCSNLLVGAGPPPLQAFGANGIAVVGKWIYVSVTFTTSQGTSAVYRLDITKDPMNLQLVRNYTAPGSIVDGLRYVAPNSLFVVVAGQSRVDVLDISSGQLRRSYNLGPNVIAPSTVVVKDDKAYVSQHAIALDPLTTGLEQNYGIVEICLFPQDREGDDDDNCGHSHGDSSTEGNSQVGTESSAAMIAAIAVGSALVVLVVALVAVVLRRRHAQQPTKEPPGELDLSIVE